MVEVQRLPPLKTGQVDKVRDNQIGAWQERQPFKRCHEQKTDILVMKDDSIDGGQVLIMYESIPIPNLPKVNFFGLSP